MTDDHDSFSRQDPARVGEVLTRTGITLGMHHGELAKHLRRSRRTVSRWAREGTRLTREHRIILAGLAQAREPALAAEIAALAGDTLASLGLEAPPPARPNGLAATLLPPHKVVDAVVCAAAEAADVSPRAIRLALVAALRCAREVGITLQAMEGVLASDRVGTL